MFSSRPAVVPAQLGKWDDWSSDTMLALDGSNSTVDRVAAMELQRVGPSYVAHIPV